MRLLLLRGVGIGHHFNIVFPDIDEYRAGVIARLLILNVCLDREMSVAHMLQRCVESGSARSWNLAMRHYLVPTDFNAPARVAFDYAAGLCKESVGRITLLHVFHLDKVTELLAGLEKMEHGSFSPKSESPSSTLNAKALKLAARNRLESLVDKEQRKQLSIRTAFEEGRPAEKIIEFARKNHVDMIVLGTHGRGEVTNYFLGSVVERVIRTAECPVLTIRGSSQ